MEEIKSGPSACCSKVLLKNNKTQHSNFEGHRGQITVEQSWKLSPAVPQRRLLASPERPHRTQVASGWAQRGHLGLLLITPCEAGQISSLVSCAKH